MADTVAVGAPITREAARRALERTRLARVAAGYRGLVPMTPLDGLVETIVAVARLAADFSDVLSEGDLNPVLVEHRTGRVSVVDALLVAAPKTGKRQGQPEDRPAEVAA
jgi:acetyltransferase